MVGGWVGGVNFIQVYFGFLNFAKPLIPLLVFYFRVEENSVGGKFRAIPCAVDIYFAGGKYRAKSKFADIAKISSTRKIRVIQ